MVSDSASIGDLKGQARVIAEVRRLVDRWRGFPLGSAADAYPEDPPRYEPGEGEHPISGTTLTLLLHWFRHEPHVLGRSPSTTSFKYWPHQRRLVETFIYLHEVRRIRRTQDLYRLAGVDPIQDQRDPWPKLGGQLATGSGKTKMMSLLIAWAYLNAVCERDNPLGLGRHALVIAPGLFVRDRLLQDFCPPDGGTSVFFSDPVIPPELESAWDLKVYSPATCPLKLDPDEGALVVTNYHQLLRARDEAPVFSTAYASQMDLLFEAGEPRRLEDVQSPLVERFARSRGLLVINDEAHHVWDEPGHAAFEAKAKEKAKLSGDDAATAMGWIRSIRRLNGEDPRGGKGRVGLQVDLSATLFEETGASHKPGKSGTATEFRPADLFRHTAMTYGLAEAIADGIVKRPILEKVEVRNKKTGEIETLVRAGQPNAWEKYKNLLVTGIERWKKVKEQLEDERDPRKPILFILCEDRTEAREIANFLSYGEAVRDDRTGQIPKGYADPETGERLFLHRGPDGAVQSTVVEIHIGQKEESSELEWEKIRRAVNAIDQDEITDPSGRTDSEGRLLRLPNPYNVVVSVMMIKEGWDVRNVKVIVPLRACDSRTLTEQTLGRGLRKMHAPRIDDEGKVSFKEEELYVIEHPSFTSILDHIRDLMEEKTSAEIEHSREYVGIEQKPEAERSEHDVRLVRFEGLAQVSPDWRARFEVNRVPDLAPRLPWREAMEESEIHTYLKKALVQGQEEGQTFTLPSIPSYRDFDHVIEHAYAIPLLRDLRASYQHKNAVKDVARLFLERKTFALPMGLPLSFDRVMEAGHGLIALGNLAREDVITAVRKALLTPLHDALIRQRSSAQPQLSERRAVELANYQAIKKHVMERAQRTVFGRAALDNEDELRMAALLDRAKDVQGWVYNHRRGVNYLIPYDWQGYTAHYLPDFIARAKIGAVFHNFIIEVKGRLDDRDKAKARRGARYCELLTEYDREPWHYLLLIENEPIGRADITWWENQSVHELADLLRRHEALPLLPDEPGQTGGFRVVQTVPEEHRFRDAAPVYDLQTAAGGFSEFQSPEPIGWAYVHARRPLDSTTFVAQIVGHSMEAGIPDGSWGLFRAYAAGEEPPPVALDGRRVVVELRGEKDLENGGRYTLKRWRVTKVSPSGAVEEVELRPDNPEYKSRRLTPESGAARVVGEFLEIVG